MGKRRIAIRETAAKSIAQVAWFIESKGLVRTAEKFTDAVYDFIETMANDMIVHAPCKDPERHSLGLKCRNFKKYTVVFIETDKDIVVTEFIPSRLIKW